MPIKEEQIKEEVFSDDNDELYKSEDDSQSEHEDVEESEDLELMKGVKLGEKKKNKKQKVKTEDQKKKLELEEVRNMFSMWKLVCLLFGVDSLIGRV